MEQRAAEKDSAARCVSYSDCSEHDVEEPLIQAHEHAQHRGVQRKPPKVRLSHQIQHELDRKQGGQRRSHRTQHDGQHGQRNGLSGDQILDLQHHRAQNRRNGHQKGKLGRLLPVYAAEQSARDRAARPRHAWQNRKCLKAAHHQCVHIVHLTLCALFFSGNKEYNGSCEEPKAQEFSGKGRLKEVAQQHRRDHRGDGGHHQQIHRLGKRMPKHFPDVPPEHHEDGDQRAHMQQGVQQDPRVVHAQYLLKEHQMPRGGDGQKFAQSLDKAKQQGLPYIHHGFFTPFLKKSALWHYIIL